MDELKLLRAFLLSLLFARKKTKPTFLKKQSKKKLSRTSVKISSAKALLQARGPDALHRLIGKAYMEHLVNFICK